MKGRPPPFDRCCSTAALRPPPSAKSEADHRRPLGAAAVRPPPSAEWTVAVCGEADYRRPLRAAASYQDRRRPPRGQSSDRRCPPRAAAVRQEADCRLTSAVRQEADRCRPLRAVAVRQEVDCRLFAAVRQEADRRRCPPRFRLSSDIRRPARAAAVR